MTATHQIARPTQANVATSSDVLSRQCACGKLTGGGGACGECRTKGEALLRRPAIGAPPESQVQPAIDEVSRSPGQPLDAGTRAFMEPRFGYDFSRVRVHADARSAESARAMNALAYTVGDHIVFAEGQYAPEAARSKRLLAHELTHVVQQGIGGGAGPHHARAMSHPSDAAEVEAEAVAERVTSGGPIRVTQPASAAVHALSSDAATGLGIAGGILGAAGLAVGIAWLAGGFDPTTFSADELRQYLALLASTQKIEGRTVSDNKARACVAREAELGPYSTPIKILLVREMIDGPTLGDDEAAIIALVRRAQPAERQQIVAAIGREALWNEFSGQNRRIIEAITLTDADFSSSALVERLRALPADELTDYRDNAVEPAVKGKIERLLQLQKITTPVDIDTPVDAAGAAHPNINGFDVSVLPDTTSQDEKYRNQAYTGLGMDFQPAIPTATQDKNGTITSITAAQGISVTIQTTYGPGTDPSGSSAYGRGTTAEDVSAGNTSLRFHEGNHGLDFLKYLREHPAPRFGGQVGMTLDQWQKAQDQFQSDVKAYYADVIRFSVQRTECPGKPITPAVAKQYYNDASICSTVRGGG